MSWAGRSAWNDRNVGIVEVAGSNPVPSTLRESRPFHEETNDKIFNILWQLKKNGNAENTIHTYAKRLYHIQRKTDIDNPEEV